MDRSFGSRIGLVVLTAAAMVGAYYVHLLFLIDNCYAGESGDGRQVPARASLQGQFCGDPDGVPFNLVLLGFVCAAIAAVILFVVAWRSSKSWVGKVASITVPAIVMGFAWGAMTLPPDSCSDSEVRRNSTASCATLMK
jgi:hypothetical protein